MAAVAVHVVDNNVVAACDGYTIILVDYDAVTDIGVVGRRKIEAIAVVRCRKAIGAIVRRVSGAVVESDVVDVEAGTVADAEAVDWVVLDVDVVN